MVYRIMAPVFPFVSKESEHLRIWPANFKCAFVVTLGTNIIPCSQIIIHCLVVSNSYKVAIRLKLLTKADLFLCNNDTVLLSKTMFCFP